MNKRSLAALILLNVVLLAALVVTVFPVPPIDPAPAHAQFGGANQYLMIAGSITGRNQQDAVYVVNLNTSQMAVLLVNTLNTPPTINVIAGRVIRNDMGVAGRGR